MVIITIKPSTSSSDNIRSPYVVEVAGYVSKCGEMPKGTKPYDDKSLDKSQSFFITNSQIPSPIASINTPIKIEDESNSVQDYIKQMHESDSKKGDEIVKAGNLNKLVGVNNSRIGSAKYRPVLTFESMDITYAESLSFRVVITCPFKPISSIFNVVCVKFQAQDPLKERSFYIAVTDFDVKRSPKQTGGSTSTVTMFGKLISGFFNDYVPHTGSTALMQQLAERGEMTDNAVVLGKSNVLAWCINNQSSKITEDPPAFDPNEEKELKNIEVKTPLFYINSPVSAVLNKGLNKTNQILKINPKNEKRNLNITSIKKIDNIGKEYRFFTAGSTKRDDISKKIEDISKNLPGSVRYDITGQNVVCSISKPPHIGDGPDVNINDYCKRFFDIIDCFQKDNSYFFTYKIDNKEILCPIYSCSVEYYSLSDSDTEAVVNANGSSNSAKQISNLANSKKQDISGTVVFRSLLSQCLLKKKRDGG